MDSSSIEVNRRARQVKTDRLDLVGLLRLLGRYVAGDARVWRVVRVPSEAEEDARHLHRMRETLRQERTRVIKAKPVTDGQRGFIDAVTVQERAIARATVAHTPDGSALRQLRVFARRLRIGQLQVILAASADREWCLVERDGSGPLMIRDHETEHEETDYRYRLSIAVQFLTTVSGGEEAACSWITMKRCPSGATS
jgi:hypothetical protein